MLHMLGMQHAICTTYCAAVCIAIPTSSIFMILWCRHAPCMVPFQQRLEIFFSKIVKDRVLSTFGHYDVVVHRDRLLQVMTNAYLSPHQAVFVLLPFRSLLLCVQYHALPSTPWKQCGLAGICTASWGLKVHLSCCACVITPEKAIIAV